MSGEAFAAGRHIVRGSLWMVGMRWLMRCIGIVSTLILARLLEPADFGVIAMAMLIVGLLEVVAQCGVDLALIRQDNPERDDYDTAWTLQLGLSAVLAVALFATAWPAASVFGEPRLVPVIQALSLRALIAGLENVAVLDFRKRLDFRTEFRFNLFRRLSSFAVVIGFAIVLRNYWALVIGMIAGQAVNVLLGYLMHPYRPRLCTRKMRSLFGFSSWIVLFRISRFLQRKVDQFVVGGVAGTHFMGVYHVASDLATLPTNEVVVPMGRALYPIYARIQGDLPQLVGHYLGVLSTVALFCVSIGLGLSLVAHDLVVVALGAKWLPLVPIMQVLALHGALLGIVNTTEAVFTVAGRVRLLALMASANILVTGGALYAVAHLAGVEQVAAARCAVSVVVLVAVFAWLTRVVPVTARDLAGALWHRFAAGAVMAAAVLAAHPDAWSSPLARLAVDVAIGAAAFTASTLLLWLLRGRPAGVERGVLTALGRRLPGRLRRGGRVVADTAE